MVMVTILLTKQKKCVCCGGCIELEQHRYEGWDVWMEGAQASIRL
jgi:hypothetical protein